MCARPPDCRSSHDQPFAHHEHQHQRRPAPRLLLNSCQLLVFLYRKLICLFHTWTWPNRSCCGLFVTSECSDDSTCRVSQVLSVDVQQDILLQTHVVPPGVGYGDCESTARPIFWKIGRAIAVNFRTCMLGFRHCRPKTPARKPLHAMTNSRHLQDPDIEMKKETPLDAFQDKSRDCTASWSIRAVARKILSYYIWSSVSPR